MDATIIAGSLNDKELKSSIDALVSYVDKKTGSMATNFDNELKRMKESLKNLGDIKVGSGEASDVGSSRRTKRNNEEAKSVRETTIAYEQLATAVQNATKPKSAEQSFYAFIQNYREHAAKLASELKTMPSVSLDRQMAEYQRFEKEINAVQRKIQELRQQLNDIGGKPSTSRFEVKAITDEINRLQTLIRQLTSEQISSTRRIAEEDNAAMVQKRALYERTIQLVRELTTEQNSSTVALQRQNEAQDQLTRKIQHQAEIIRQRLQENGSGVATWGTKVIYDPNDSRNVKMKQAQLSIEEQLLQAHQQQVAITQERIAAEQRENKTKQETVASAQAQAQAEQQVTQAQQQRTSAQTKKNFQSYEDFAQALAHVLGLQQQEIRLADSETASYNRLQQTLKTLQSVYNQLSNSERNSDNGKTLVASMHEVQRAIQKIQQQAARPVNLMAAMGLSEKTLDDIAYKMQMLSRYRNGINLSNPNSRNEIQRVNSELERLKSTQDKLIGQNARYAHSNELLGRSFDYIKNRIAFVLTVGTMTQFTKSIYEIRGQYELLERSIGILFDSMQQGSQIFAELNAMAIKSPFTTMELGAAAKQLSAYDIAAKDVVDTTRRLADMAAAVGVPIERLTYALGQIKAYGYLNARDARMFANAGIPLVQNLADMYTKLEGRLVSVGDIYDRIKKKAISFEDVLKVVNEMTGEGGRFFNFQEKAADTLKVKLANLTLAYNNMLNEIGKSNQTLITAPLVGLKKLYENWRNINNIILSTAAAYGILKTAQILYIAYTSKVSLATAAADVASKRLVGTLYAMKGALVSLASNPFTWITAVLASLGYMYFQMRDLDEATEQFNKSISQNAQENIDSINKFFNEYKKDIDTINSLNTADQQKMWERIREEIEKTSKNAQQYIDILEKINNVSSRVKFASDYLSQLQQIQQEAQRLADHGAFSVGGGFGNDALATDLQDYERTMNSVLKRYGSLEKAQQDFSESLVTWSSGQYAVKYYNEALKEAEKELRGFVGSLNDVDLGKVLGEGTSDEQLANLREFANIVRDNFLATEKGQKISSEGRALLNKQLDNWIAKNGVQNRLLTEENAQIEANRTAWETFFSQLNKKEKETVDYLVETNQIGSDEFKKIWDNAAKKMKDSAITSYQAIQEQIATLRNTPDIVINVVYKQNKEQLDEQQQQYKETFLTPEGKGVLSAENYLKQVQELTTKYGRFQKKENENNVEWEKRLGETYRDNESSLKRLNAQLNNSANLSDVDRKAKEGERDALIAENKVLDEIKTKQNFNYEKDKKDKKDKKGRKDEDIVAEALKQELQLIKEMQSNYDKLRKSGVSNMDAIDLASKGYEATIIRINQVLSKFGIDKFNAANFAGKDVRSLLQALEQQRAALLASGKVKTSSLQALDVEIQKLTVDAKTYDMKKVTDGLNSELGKIKDEYELAIELDANPELGSMFADMFDINTDTLPKTIKEYADKYTQYLNKYLESNHSDLRFGVGELFNLTQDDINAFQSQVSSGAFNQAWFDEIKKAYDDINGKRRKELKDIFNNTKKLEYELAELNDKIAIKEKEQALLHEKIEKEKNETTKHYLELTYQSNEKAIDELRSQALSLMPEYARVFNSIAEYSAGVSRRLQRDLMRVFDEAKYDSANKKWTLTGSDGKQTILNDTQYRKEREKLTREMRKSQEPFKKIKEAFKPSDKNGVVDYAKGIELVSTEIQKLGSVASEVGNLAQIFGADEQTVEIINDVATSLNGVATAGQGISQIASGDYIGGAASVLSGITSIIGAWADNNNKRIDTEIKDSELAVKRLENTYKNLEFAIENAYGANAIGAKQAAIANKELQLAELERQLTLEKSRDSKDRDEDKIVELQGQIIDLQNNIKKSAQEMATELLGISSVGDAALSFMDAYISALRKGEDAQKAFTGSWKEMIANMIKQIWVTKVIGPQLEALVNELNERIKNRSKKETEDYENAVSESTRRSTMSDDEIRRELARNHQDIIDKRYEEMKEAQRKAAAPNNSALSSLYDGLYRIALQNYQLALLGVGTVTQKEIDAYRSEGEKSVKDAKNALNKATIPTIEDMDMVAQSGKDLLPLLQSSEEQLNELLKRYGLYDDQSNKTLSALQQGIQGITEDTAGAIEAYMNIVAQRVFEQNLYLQEIRDHLNNFDLDVQLGTLSQMLLQLQQSYQVQQNIESILTGVLNPSGRAIVVELNS